MANTKVMTDTGAAWQIDKLDDTVSGKNNYVGWGAGSAAPATSDAALGAEASEARVQGTMSQPDSKTSRLTATMVANGTKTIAEWGRFTASTGGVMTGRTKLDSAIPMLSGDSIIITDDDTLTNS